MMSEKAKTRLEAIGRQLGGESGGLAAIKTIAGKPDGPRAAGKVVIITGNVTLPTHTSSWSVGSSRWI